MVSAPVRTCIGCRQRVEIAELLRIVVEPGTDPVRIVPDPRRRAPGRGASLHPVLACLELAERRRAFVRALRVSGAVDPTPVRQYVAQHGSDSPVQRKTAGRNDMTSR
ncbi:MAG TPA: YlxR family protein [Jatrophihabitans sp.]